MYIIISTKKDQGITQLIDIIGKFVEKGCRTEGSFITRSRHRDALEKTKNHLSMIVKNDLLDVNEIYKKMEHKKHIYEKYKIWNSYRRYWFRFFYMV